MGAVFIAQEEQLLAPPPSGGGKPSPIGGCGRGVFVVSSDDNLCKGRGCKAEESSTFATDKLIKYLTLPVLLFPKRVAWMTPASA